MNAQLLSLSIAKKITDMGEVKWEVKSRREKEAMEKKSENEKKRKKLFYPQYFLHP